MVALIEDLRVEIEKVGECKAVDFTEFLGRSIAEDVFGLGGSIAEDVFGLESSGGRCTMDELVELEMDCFRGGLRLALRCGIGGGPVFWDTFFWDPVCGTSEKLFSESGVAGGEGGRSGGNP